MLDYYWPQTIEKIQSEFNGEIKVVKFRGRYAVWAGGVEQSGPMVSNLWQKALQGLTLRTQGETLKTLILGLGCGVITKFFPKTKITGVEIDPVMIEIGKKYFDLDKNKKLKIVCQDAFKVFKDVVLRTQDEVLYGLIICDLYRGNKVPDKLFSDIFLTKLSQTLAKNGTVIFNFLKPQYGNFVREDFLDKIAKSFIVQKRIETEYNEIFFVRGEK